MVNYSIGDLLVRLKNSSLLMKKQAIVPKFKFGIAVLELFKKEGYIVDYEILGNEIAVSLQYAKNGLPMIQDVKLFSTPGRRWYVKSEEMTAVRSGSGVQIVSTPRGVMTTAEAKKMNVGGELICEVW